MEQKILIIGAQGMLGHDVAEAFSDYEPTCWDKDELDITDKKSVVEKLTELKPTIIINTAAYTDVDGAETEQGKEIALAVNGTAVGYLSEAAQKIGALFVHYSTEYVFNGINKDGYRENDPVSPVNVYGESKALGEKLLQQNTDIFYIIRSSWLYGKAPQRGKPRGLNFAQTMLKLAETKKEISVVNNQFGKPTYTLDLALKTRQIIDEKKPYGIYHIANDGVCTWYDFAKKIFEIKGINVMVKPITSEEYPAPTPRPKYSVLLNTELEPLRTWEEALKEYLA